MTVRDGIIDFLSRQAGYITSSKLHRHLTNSGYVRASCGSSLARMVARGEVMTLGSNRDTSIKLNPEYKHTETSARQIANHAHLGKPVKRAPAKPVRKENSIFELCREHSAVYQMDKLLREVRL